MNAGIKYMLDTVIFNRVLDGKISLSCLNGYRLLVIGVQRDELDRTCYDDRRGKLLAIFQEIRPEVVPASSFVFDIEGAGWDQAYWNDGTGVYESMLRRLKELDPKEKDPKSQIRDVLIAETAIKNGAVLVSDDGNLPPLRNGGVWRNGYRLLNDRLNDDDGGINRNWSKT